VNPLGRQLPGLHRDRG